MGQNRGEAARDWVWPLWSSHKTTCWIPLTHISGPVPLLTGSVLHLHHNTNCCVQPGLGMSFTYVKLVPTGKHWFNIFIFEAKLKVKSINNSMLWFPCYWTEPKVHWRFHKSTWFFSCFFLLQPLIIFSSMSLPGLRIWLFFTAFIS